MLTDAELEPDPIYTGKICDRCMECVKNCHGHAISPTETVKAVIGGVEVEWAKRDEMACSKAFREGGLNRELSPFDGNYPRKYGYGMAHEGSCGCIRACMVHLEERRKLTHGFREPFRQPGWKQWEVDHSKPYELPPEIREAYAGNIESQDAYTNYNIKSNYGTKAAAGLVQDNSSSGGVA